MLQQIFYQKFWRENKYKHFRFDVARNDMDIVKNHDEIF